MNTPPLTIEYDRSGRHLTAYVAGELDAATAPLLTAGVADHLRREDQIVWLDLAEVTFCDSSGVAALANLHRSIGEGGGRLTLYNPGSRVLRVLSICGLDQVLSVWTQPSDRDAAPPGVPAP